MIANSFINAMFISLWEFSITFAASAIFIDFATYVPASIIDEYSLSINLVTEGVEPDTTFTIFSIVCFLSPGLILSGEYPQ